MREPEEVDASVRRIEELIENLGAADPHSREMAEEAIRLLMQLYGDAFRRVIGVLDRTAAEGLAQDKLVSSLLLLHGLHPIPVEKRIEEALQRVELRLDGAHFALEGIVNDAAHVRVERNGGSAPPAALAAMIERAVAESAPEIDAVKIEGLPEPLVQIT